MGLMAPLFLGLGYGAAQVGTLPGTQSGAPPSTSARTPQAIAQQYATLDAKGGRLEAGPDDPMAKLALDDGEPASTPIVLIDHFEAGTPERVQADRVRVPVRYVVEGVVHDEGEAITYAPGRRKTTEYLTLVQSGSDWKVLLAALQFPPHVTRAAYLHHLDTLLAAFGTPEEKAGPRYRSLIQVQRRLREQPRSGLTNGNGS